MKKLVVLASIAIAMSSQAQTNLITDPGFEALASGYSGFVTISGGKTKGMSGKWQMIFAKGGCPTGCGRGTASIVTTTKKSGNNAIEVKIDTQLNRNDIRLFQSINNVPAGVYEVSFFIKSDVPSPIAIDALKSSQPFSNNGSAPYTGIFSTTTEWQQIKFTVDITEWSDDDRNEMRLSLRFNNNKALPQGPYPKTFWADDFSFVKK